MKKTLLYVIIIVVLAVLLVLGFKAPRTTKNNSSAPTVQKTENKKQQKETPKIDANAQDNILNLDNFEQSEIDKKKEEEVKEKNESIKPVSSGELNSALSGFPLSDKTELSLEAYRAFRRNNLVDLNEWDEAQVAGTPALQVIGNGARAYFKINLKDAKDALEFYSNQNINTNGWRYDGSFKEDVVNHKPEFKGGTLYAGEEKIEKGKHISYALSKEKHFGTVTFFHPRFDDDFLVMFVDVTKE